MPELPKITQRIEVKSDLVVVRKFNRELESTERALGNVDSAAGNASSTIDQDYRRAVIGAERETRTLGKTMGNTADEAGDLGRQLAQTARRTKGASKETKELNKSVKEIRGGLKTFGQLGSVALTALALKLPVVVAGFEQAASGVAALGAGMIGLLQTMGPLLNNIALLPALLAAAVGGFGALLIAAKPVGEALGLAFKEPVAAGGGGGETARQRARRLADAIKDVERAQESLSDSQRDAERAQIELNEAYLDATENLRDLRQEQDRGAISVSRAEIAIGRAKENQLKVNADSTSTEADRLEALLDVQDAELDLKDAQEKRIDLARDLHEAEKQGVEGSDAVKDAAERQSDALTAVADAQLALSRAVEDQRDPEKDAAGAAAAVDQYAEALKKLSPEAREFVETLRGQKPLFTEIRNSVQDALFGPINEGLGGLLAQGGAFKSFLTQSAAGLGELGKTIIGFFSTPEFGADLEILGKQNGDIIKSLAAPARDLLRIFTDLAVVGGPFVKEIVDLAAGAIGRFADKISGMRADGGLAQFFRDGIDRAKEFGRIFRDLFIGLANVFGASTGLGEDLLGTIGELAAKFRAWTESFTGQLSLVTFFEQAKAPLHEFFGLVGDLFKLLGGTAIGNMGGLTDTLKFLRTEGVPILKEILDAVGPKFVHMVLELAASFGKLFAALFGESSSLQIFIGTMTDVFNIIGNLLDTVPGLKEFVIVAVTVGSAFKVISLLGKASGLSKTIELLGKFTGLTKGLKGGAAAAKVAFAGGGGLTGAVKAFGAALLTAISPVGLIVIAIAALVAGLVYAYFHFEGFRKVVDSTFDAVQEIVSNFVAGVKELWSRFGDDIMRVVKGVWGTIKGQFEIGINLVLAVVQPIIDILHGDWAKAWEDFRDRIKGVWGGIKDYIGGIIDIIRGLIGGWIEGMREIPGKILGILDGIWDFLWEQFEKVPEKIGGFITDVVNILTGLPQKVLDAASGIWDFLSDQFKDTVNAIIGLWNRLRELLQISIHIDPLGDWGPALDVDTGPLLPHINPIGGTSKGKGSGQAGQAVARAASGARIGQGFMTNGARVVVGEGKSQFPEFVIPTDPTYRKNTFALIDDLLRRVGTTGAGARMFAGGGTLDQLATQGAPMGWGGTNVERSVGYEQNFAGAVFTIHDYDDFVEQMAQERRRANLAAVSSGRSPKR